MQDLNEINVSVSVVVLNRNIVVNAIFMKKAWNTFSESMKDCESEVRFTFEFICNLCMLF